MVNVAVVTSRPDSTRTAAAQSADRVALNVDGADAAVALYAACSDVAVALDAERTVAAVEQWTTRTLAAPWFAER